MAPEVMEQKNGYDIKADIWSLGMTAIEMAEGVVPYHDKPAMQVFVNIINKDPPKISSFEPWS